VRGMAAGRRGRVGKKRTEAVARANSRLPKEAE